MGEAEKTKSETAWKRTVYFYRLISALIFIGVVVVWVLVGLKVPGLTMEIALISSGGAAVLWILLGFASKAAQKRSGLIDREGFVDTRNNTDD